MRVNVKFAPPESTALVESHTSTVTAALATIVRLERRLRQRIHAPAARTQLIRGFLSQVSATTALPEAIAHLAP